MFAEFCEAVRALLDETDADKGYHQAGLSGANPMYEFVAETAGGPGDALTAKALTFTKTGHMRVARG